MGVDVKIEEAKVAKNKGDRIGQRKRWRKRYPEKRKEYERSREMRKNYGISPEDYERLFRRQQGKCAICGKEQTSKRLAIDHSHETDKIRGLLCTRCNVGLGMFQDDPELLIAALGYLRG